jgi:hypothetical protein
LSKAAPYSAQLLNLWAISPVVFFHPNFFYGKNIFANTISKVFTRFVNQCAILFLKVAVGFVQQSVHGAT